MYQHLLSTLISDTAGSSFTNVKIMSYDHTTRIYCFVTTLTCTLKKSTEKEIRDTGRETSWR
jgi:hypothetical protein